MSTDTALLVIDVQNGMFLEDYPVYNGEVLLERINSLITRARSCGVSVIYIQHNEGAGEPLETNSPGWDIHPAVAPAEGEPIIQKHTPDSFHETNLQRELSARGIRKLVLAGIQTDCCVDATCRRAFDLGYELVIAKDAHSTWGQGNVGADQIIDRYNSLFQEFADVIDSVHIKFG